METLSGGQWTLTPSPGSGSDHNAAGLTSVACQTAGACVAVGQLTGPTPPILGATVGRWSATAGPTPEADDGATGLWGVSCASSSGCLAVGRARPADSPSTYAGAIGDPRGVLIERDAGGTWTTAPGPKGLPGDERPARGGLRGPSVRGRRHVGPGERVVALGAHADHRGTRRVRAWRPVRHPAVRYPAVRYPAVRFGATYCSTA